jgi:filamentous hemagglutinin family protein
MKAHHCRKRRLFLTANKLVSVITLIFFSAGYVFALPAGQQVVNGQASFATQGNNLTITNSPSAIINWQGFSINSNEAVRFIQQSSTSAVLNRVIGQDPSRILGLLQSNGRVFLINPNGILFGQGARIDVNGLVASTLAISNQDFLAGKYNFTAGALAGPIQNQGTITTPAGGNVYLIAPDIENSGIINSPQGDVILAAGHSVQLVDSFNPDIAVVVSAPADKAVNLGQIVAQSGKVGIYGGLIAQRGIVSADSAVSEGGRIFLKATKAIELADTSVISADGAKGGRIIVKTEENGQISGTLTGRGLLSAQGDGSKDSGGFIETSAAKVDLNGIRVRTNGGNWLIDPDGFTIAASGGDIDGATLSGNLGEGDIEIFSTDGSGEDGNINVNDTVSWSAYKLTLSATNDVNINAVMTASDEASLDLSPGSNKVNVGFNPDGSFKGRIDFPDRSGTGFLTINGNGYTVINSLGAEGSFGADLQGMRGNLAGYYALGSNINASNTSGWNNDTGFEPVGDGESRFIGVFDGLGHTITDLYIDRPTTDAVGLFGYNSGDVRNVGLANVNITGQSYVGGLVGYNYYYGGSISNSISTGTVTGDGGYGGYYVGGLVGYNEGAINNSHSGGTVRGTVTGTGSYVGGLAGYNTLVEGAAAISNSYSTATVDGGDSVGGLVGYNDDSITNSYSTGTVTGSDSVGGLVGENYGAISDSYNAGEVNGSSSVGGLVGYDGSEGGGGISNSYNTGAVTGTGDYVGGLVGYDYYSSIDYSYNTGAVIGSTNVGGLVGYSVFSSIDYSYNTGEVTGTGDYVGGLVGYNDSSSISNSYSTGEVTGSTNVGGLVGYNDSSSIDYSYSTGAVTGSTNVGGLVGYDSSGGEGISSSYWDTETSGQESSDGGEGLMTYQMMDPTNYLGWTFDSEGYWWMSDTNTRPFLRSEYSTNIANAHQLQLMALDLGASYTLAGDIDMSELTQASGLWNITTGFVPVGSNSDFSFTGAFDGLGHTITDLYIDRPTTAFVGLFGFNSGVVRNVGLVNVNITGQSRVGGLMGMNYYNGGSISNSYSTGTVTGTGTGTEGGYVGGLVGHNEGAINNSYSSGAVSGDSSVGGLVGLNTQIEGDATISNSYSTATVGGDSSVGGLVGYNDYRITNSYSTGAVNGTGDYVGGLVGYNLGGITNSYSTGAVSGYSLVGGLVGFTADSITNSYSTGAVSGDLSVGGLVGVWGGGAITNSYWNIETSGQPTSSGGTGKTTAQMKQQATFAGWDFVNTWGIVEGSSYPYLQWQPDVPTPQQTISGMLDVALAGKIIYFVVDGTLLPDYTSTIAGGLYSISLSGNPVPDNSALLVYVYDDNVKGNSVYLSSGGNISNLLIASNTLIAKSGGGTMSNTTLRTAKGLLDHGEILYYVDENLTVTLYNGFNFRTASGTSYSLNGNITTDGGSQAYNGPVILLRDAILSAGTGNISFFGPVTGTGFNFTLSSQSLVTQTAPVSVSGLELLGTGGTYNLTDADNAVTTLAGNTGTVNFTNSTELVIGTVNTEGLATSGDFTLNGGGAITQSAPLQVGGAATFNAGAENDITLNNASNSLSSVGITSGKDVSLTNTGALSLNASTVSNTLSATAGGNITLNGLVEAGAGDVTLSSGGAIINGMGGSTSISANTLTANAVNGIGSGDPLMTEVYNLNAVNTTANNIEFDNTGVLTVGDLSNGGTGDVILQNIGAVTTGESTVTSGGSVSITALSPLTIGSGGVSATDSISLEASASGGSDDLTINGNIASATGNIILRAGSSILGTEGRLSAPNGTITLTDGLNPSAPDLSDTGATGGNATATNSTVTAFETIEGTTIATVETTSDSDEKEEEERKKKKEVGEQTTDDKNTDDKKYCN